MNPKRLTMRRLKDVLRLKFSCKLSNRDISKSISISASTVSYYTRAFTDAGLTWPLPEQMTDSALVAALEPYCKQLTLSSSKSKQLPCFETVHHELKQKGVTLQLLWQEYKARYQRAAYSYTEFCRRYREFAKQLNPVMRQVHKAGEKCFVDYAGPTLTIYHPQSGESLQAKIFVATLGASNFTFVYATLTRSIPDWLESHTKMLEFFGGVPQLIIPDNEKAGVTHACYYDPEKNPHYTAWASHYHTTVLPTRPGKPQDKAKVEAAVKLVESAIMAPLRHQKFFSIDELNDAIKPLLKQLNDKPFQKLTGSRRSQFEALEKSTLAPLPSQRYEHAIIKRVKVGLDYHVCIEGHYYSVPYQHINQTVDYRLSRQQVEIYRDGQRIASHLRQEIIGEKTTLTAHMPAAHQAHAQWTPASFLQWAQRIAQPVTDVAHYLIRTQPHPECCYRSFLGLKRLDKTYGNKRFVAACQYVMQNQTISFRSLESVLKNRLENNQENPPEQEKDFTSPSHANIRGSTYYH